MTPFRVTIYPDHVIVHAPLGEREPTMAEADQIREALAPKPLPLWFDLGVVAAGIAALALIGHGISKGVIGS